jgi:flagellar hook assembly protein FlgD
LTLLPNYPNPFNASTRIRFELPSADHVTVEVFDVLGRGVLTLADHDLPAGTHELTWTGKDARGNAAASGQYFVRLRTRAEMRSLPILLLK